MSEVEEVSVTMDIAQVEEVVRRTQRKRRVVDSLSPGVLQTMGLSNIEERTRVSACLKRISLQIELYHLLLLPAGYL